MSDLWQLLLVPAALAVVFVALIARENYLSWRVRRRLSRRGVVFLSKVKSKPISPMIQGVRAAMAARNRAVAEPRRGSALVRIPGVRIDELLGRLCPRTNKQVFRPIRADILDEWRASEIDQRRFLSWWIRYVRYPYLLGSHILKQIPFSIIRWIAAVLKAAP